MANSKKPKMQEVKEVGTPGKSTNYQRARREAAEELRKQEEEELSEQTRSGEMGGEEGRKEEKIEKEETNKKETKRRSSKTTTPKKKSERAKTPLCAQGELTPAEAGTSVKRSKVPLFPQTPQAEGRVAAAPKSPSPISTTTLTPPPIKSPAAPEENRLEARMVNGCWCVMVNGGWVELGFHEERPHQVTPILLPAKQVSRENHYWGLDSLEDPPRGGEMHPLWLERL